LKASEATRWLSAWLKEEQVKQPDVTETEDYDEMFMRIMRAKPLAKRQELLDPEERLAPETQEKVRRRMQGGDH